MNNLKLAKLLLVTETRNNWLPNLRLNYQADVGTNNNVAGPYFGFGYSFQLVWRTRSKQYHYGISQLGYRRTGLGSIQFGAYGAQNKVANSDITVEQNQYAQSKYRAASLHYRQLSSINPPTELSDHTITQY